MNRQKYYKIIKNNKIKILLNIIENETNYNREEQKINLIIRGQIIDVEKTYIDYNIQENDNIQAFIINRTNNNNRNNNGQERNNDSNLLYDENAVSFYTILFHFMILVIVLGFIFLYKTMNELFAKSTLILFQLLCIFWIFQASKCAAKVMVHKKIIYN